MDEQSTAYAGIEAIVAELQAAGIEIRYRQTGNNHGYFEHGAGADRSCRDLHSRLVRWIEGFRAGAFSERRSSMELPFVKGKRYKVVTVAHGAYIGIVKDQGADWIELDDVRVEEMHAGMRLGLMQLQGSRFVVKRNIMLFFENPLDDDAEETAGDSDA